MLGQCRSCWHNIQTMMALQLGISPRQTAKTTIVEIVQYNVTDKNNVTAATDVGVSQNLNLAGISL